MQWDDSNREVCTKCSKDLRNCRFILLFILSYDQGCISNSLRVCYFHTHTHTHTYTHSMVRPTEFSSVAQSCPTLCDPMNRSTPGLPVHHQLLEFTQTHIHWVGDAIQPSHPLSSPSPRALSLSQHQGLFKWVSSSHQVAKVPEFQLQHQSFQWIHRTDLL